LRGKNIEKKNIVYRRKRRSGVLIFSLSTLVRMIGDGWVKLVG